MQQDTYLNTRLHRALVPARCVGGARTGSDVMVLGITLDFSESIEPD